MPTTPTGPRPWRQHGSLRIGTPTGGASDITDAMARLRETLDFFGLGSLTDWAWNQIRQGVSETIIMQELRQRPEYLERFPAMAELRGKGRAIDEATYINLERGYAQVMRFFSLPAGFYDDPSDFATFIGGEVSTAELEERLTIWRRVADEAAADPERASTLDELGRLYGITADSGEFLALVIDKTRGLDVLQRQERAARLGAVSLRSGFGELSRGEAESLGGLGLDEGAAAAGFESLVRSAELFRALPGREGSERGFSRDEQLGVAFEGGAGSREALRRQARGREAEFEAGGGFGRSREGVALGGAR